VFRFANEPVAEMLINLMTAIMQLGSGYADQIRSAVAEFKFVDQTVG
jgi:hypothetical protein